MIDPDNDLTAQLTRQDKGPVAGVDEAGRGACAGPITIAACILPPPESDTWSRHSETLALLDDSKKLTARRRQAIFDVLTQVSDFCVVSLSAQDIDRMGIHVANLEGMRRAVAGLAQSPGHVLTDAWRVDGLAMPHTPVVGGDALDRSIAAASVLAKVSRDAYMADVAQSYPQYGFDRHKGYSTKAHMDAVRQHGASAIHRYTYSNVATAHEEYLGLGQQALDM